MALVATHDWSNDMDNRQQRSHNNPDPNNMNAASAVSQQTQSPGAYAQPPYGYGHPQQASPPWHMSGMNMAQPGPGYFPPMQFYPQHYPHPQQSPSPPQMHGGSPYGQPPQMFDPNAQFAQWAAYQQMMFNAQQSHQLSLSPQQSQQQQQQQQRGHTGSHSSSNASTPTNDYYQPPFGNSRFQGSNPQVGQQSSNGGQYQGFHPYRRPERGERRPHVENSLNGNGNTVPFQPPYARSDAAGSSTSVNSSSSTSHRSRTNSGTSATASARPQANQQNSSKHTARQSSTSSTTSTPRSGSSSSSTVSSSTLSTPGSAAAVPRTSRPSPLSQGSILSAAERRKSRDDSDLATMFNSAVNLGDSSPSTPIARSGLKGRLRRALSLSATQNLREEEEESSRINGKQKERAGDAEGEDASSMATKKTKKSLRMFNSRFNASTDNISLSSTVSSASVMIRKLGSMGKLARRSSLAGITSLFKEKDKNKDGDEDATDSKGKNAKGKGRKADASVSHVTAEVDKSNDWSGPGMEGLSPAAKLARQHTLKSNAEAAARAKAQQEAQAAATAAAASGSGANGENLPTTWERNTATKHGVNLGNAREDGMRVVVEEDSDEDGEMRRQSEDFGSGSDEDSTWHGHGHEEDEDLTVRMTRDKSTFDEEAIHNGQAEGDDDVLEEPWAVNCRRSVERNLKPARGILKNTVNYQQGEQPVGPNAAFMQRVRSNSYDSVPSHQAERGPLAHMPPGDPDAIDGLHRHNSHRSTSSTIKESAANGPPLLPPLQFDASNTLAPSISTSASADGDKRSSMFNHPSLNNSEPALSTITNTQPTLSHRSASSPAKRLAFAANLSIYDTFSSSTYDRRSEPATWSRLTPALAQRIKEELNSYKMEEMEVHAASRIHTQFFV